jgi:hypothetical protein
MKTKETIYDHEVTTKEIRQMFGFQINQEAYKKIMGSNKALADISTLYTIRGNDKTAQKYFDMIQDQEFKERLLMAWTGCLVGNPGQKKCKIKLKKC